MVAILGARMTSILFYFILYVVSLGRIQASLCMSWKPDLR